MVASKEQERQALEQIRKIVAAVGGADSYIGMAIDGCLEIAEENIENDFALSMKRQLENAQRDTKCFQKKAGELSDKLARANHELDRLKEELDRELEWKDYEIPENVWQADYDNIVNQGDTRFLTDEEAKDILYNWYGFAKEKVTILKSVPIYQINRHQQLRTTGEQERRPAYNATDWNYIRFDCGAASYELHDDTLSLFLQ